jgi:diguanylate cyclase (GGDEF)-like protein/hemerythrin-like metal-binding protein
MQYFRTLQAKLSIFLLLTGLVLIILSLYLLIGAWQEDQRSRNIMNKARQAGYLFNALKDLPFERGRTNVVLSSGKPVSERDRSFIDERRRRVDENIGKGIALIGQNDPALAEDLRRAYADHLALRKKIDAVLSADSTADRSELREIWFAQTSAFIRKIIRAFEIFGKRQDLPGHLAAHHRLMIYTLEFRDRIGQSASIVTAALSRNTPLTGNEYQSFLANLSQADYVWGKMEAELQVLHEEALQRQKSAVFEAYYGKYRPALEESILLNRTQMAQPNRFKKLQNLSVPAFDSVFLLMEAYKKTVSAEIKDYRKKVARQLVFALFQFLIGVLLVSFTIAYFRIRLFRPLNRIIQAIKDIRSGKAAPTLGREMQYADEIGQLSAGVKLLETTMAEERHLRELSELRAVTDELTGIYNRHYFDLNIGGILERADRYGETLSLVSFDLDAFKRVNDTWGHPAGDAVLAQSARLAQSLVRSSDLLFRFGGEEFLLVMPHTPAAGAFAAAEKIRQAFEEYEHPEAGVVTASFGVTERKEKESFNAWYARTDRALYAAKQSGRNRVVSATDSLPLVSPVHLEWMPAWESGHPQIDEQHRKLVDLANSFLAAALQPESQPADAMAALERLLENLARHFAYEEKLLSEAGYPGAADHAALHARLLEKTRRLTESHPGSEAKATDCFSYVVNDVVIGHMLSEDRRFFPYVRP